MIFCKQDMRSSKLKDSARSPTLGPSRPDFTEINSYIAGNNPLSTKMDLISRAMSNL